MNKRQQYKLCIISVSFILLTYIFYPSSQSIPIISQEQKPQLNKMQDGYLFSVAVNNREHYIAKKVSKNYYELLYVNPHQSIERGQPVHTTGLDQQFPEDVLVGYILKIEKDPNSIYQKVYVGPK